MFLSVLIASVMLVSCQPLSTESEVRRIAESFCSEYMDFLNRPAMEDPAEELIAWIDSSMYVTQEFKRTLRENVTLARKEDPELGLDCDPILNAQDYPDKGFLATRIQIRPNSAVVVMQGIDWPEFQMYVQLKKENGEWRISAIGQRPSSE